MKTLVKLFILLLFAQLSRAEDLKVTFVKKEEVKNFKSKVKAYVTFKLNNVFVIEDAKIIEGKKGKFVAMPSEKYKNEWKDICFPLTKELRKSIEDAIINSKFGPIPTEKQKVNITEVRIFKTKSPKSKVKAFASITLNNSFVIREIRIVEGKNGLFIGWPSKREESGSWKKIVYPVAQEQEIENIILKKYEEEAE